MTEESGRIREKLIGRKSEERLREKIKIRKDASEDRIKRNQEKGE
jgi:hypothetical protein